MEEDDDDIPLDVLTSGLSASDDKEWRPTCIRTFNFNKPLPDGFKPRKSARLGVLGPTTYRDPESEDEFDSDVDVDEERGNISIEAELVSQIEGTMYPSITVKNTEGEGLGRENDMGSEDNAGSENDSRRSASELSS